MQLVICVIAGLRTDPGVGGPLLGKDGLGGLPFPSGTGVHHPASTAAMHLDRGPAVLGQSSPLLTPLGLGVCLFVVVLEGFFCTFCCPNEKFSHGKFGLLSPKESQLPQSRATQP